MCFITEDKIDSINYTLQIPINILEEIREKMSEVDRSAEKNSCYNTTRYYDPISLKEYALHPSNTKIKELNLVLGRSPKLKKYKKKTPEKNA